jgi:hypothetical protein
MIVIINIWSIIINTGIVFFHNDRLDNDMEHEISHDIFGYNVVISFHDKHDIPKIKMFWKIYTIINRFEIFLINLIYF